MDTTAIQMSTAIERVARPLAEWSVNRLEELVPDLPDRHGATWRADWVAATQVSLHYLAQAVAVRSPSLFASSVVWARDARDAPAHDSDADLRQSLVALREILLDSLPEPASRTAAEHVDVAIERLAQNGSPAAENPAALDAATPLGEAGLRFIEAVLEGRRDTALDMIEELARGGTPVPTIYAEVLRPAMAEIGRMWQRDEVTIADEHFASRVTEIAMGMLRAHFDRGDRKDRRLLAAAVGGELHDLGVRMVADLFEMDGWTVQVLGANTPDVTLLEAVRAWRPDLVALSVISGLNVRACGEAIHLLRSDPDCAGVRVLVGGQPFRDAPDLWKEVGADGCADSAETSVRVGNELVAG